MSACAPTSAPPDVRYMVVASAPTREAALSAAQSLTARLAPLVDSGVIAGVESAEPLPAAGRHAARAPGEPAGAGRPGTSGCARP